MKNHGKLVIGMTVDFVVIYLVMYTMIATLDHFRLNINTAFMTLMMVMPTTMVMLLSRRPMFESRRLNFLISLSAALVFLASLAAMRAHAAVGDAELLRTMIPHHSGAILMCEQSVITDAEIIDLCTRITNGQKSEIAEMQGILDRL